MKTVVVFAALMALAAAQYSCRSCDAQSSRKIRTGCRMFCYLDYIGKGFLDKVNLRLRLDADKDTDNGMTLERFRERARDNVKLCSEEARRVFDLLTDLGGGDPNLVEYADLEALVD